MSRALVVRGLDDELVRRLKLRAARHNRSAEAEHREILKQALSGEPNESFKKVAAELRAMTRGRAHTPAEMLLRESREER
jgi:plasmid stability protein